MGPPYRTSYSSAMGSRILPEPADQLRAAIRENHGHEVFAIGDMDGGSVASVTITARGTADRVIALVDRPRPGQVVIHNHPSGDLSPSDPDLQLAGIYGEAGVGVVIVDNEVTRANWVLEPYLPAKVLVSEDEVRRVFEVQLASIWPGYEPRAAQIEMALAVTESLNEGRPLAVEAGTGTGKSLAYLVPAALWALGNESKVVISTFTRTLQGQLMTSDVPSLRQAGLDVRVELLQGRNNYLCRRRLELARTESAEDPEPADLLETLASWSDSTADGSRLDLPEAIDAPLWERVNSSSDLTLRARCPHFARCHWYTALRRAAAAHLVIVNHALLLADRSLVTEVGRGILPKYERLILDEAHHLEDAATSAASKQVSALAIRNALTPLLDRPKRPGALSRLARTHFGTRSKLPEDLKLRAEAHVNELAGAAEDVLMQSEDTLGALSEVLVDGLPQRVTEAYANSARFRQDVRPPLLQLAASLEAISETAAELREIFADLQLEEHEQQPLLDVRRAQFRAVAHTDVLRGFLAPKEGHARWFERARRRNQPASALICWSPIDVAAELQRVLWNPLPGTICTSATLTVAGSFQSWADRVGGRAIPTLLLPSPFDHFNQAILALPRDIAEPNAAPYEGQVVEALRAAIRASDGGAFVLCTSHATVERLGFALRQSRDRTVLCQGEDERTNLLRRFREDRRAVLVGTDSFWEGVSIQGDQLRLVVIPRIPFRVPTDPLQEARHEALEAAGIDPFRALTLPAAVLKLRQGYGRLIRSKTDRGAVLLLDTRIHSKSYGRILLQSLPPARRVKGPLHWIESELRGFFEDP